MKLTTCLLIPAAALALAGCSSLVSLHPFVTDEQAVFDPALVGIWAEPGKDELYIIRQDGKGYTIRRVHDTETEAFTAKLYRVENLRILDVASANDDPFQIPVHTPLRIWIDGGTLRFAMLDSDWLKKNARKQLAIQNVGDRALITAAPDAVMHFLFAYGAGDDSYGKPTSLERQQ
jgi:hypothetical protein